MPGGVERALRDVRDTLIEEPVSPRVETAEDINRHYCRYVAETVVDRVGEEYDVRILEDGGHGYAHTWIARGGRHYDAECVEGVDDYHDLPSSNVTPRRPSTSNRGLSTNRRLGTGETSRSILNCDVSVGGVPLHEPATSGPSVTVSADGV